MPRDTGTATLGVYRPTRGKRGFQITIETLQIIGWMLSLGANDVADA